MLISRKPYALAYGPRLNRNGSIHALAEQRRTRRDHAGFALHTVTEQKQIFVELIENDAGVRGLSGGEMLPRFGQAQLGDGQSSIQHLRELA